MAQGEKKSIEHGSPEASGDQQESKFDEIFEKVHSLTDFSGHMKQVMSPNYFFLSSHCTYLKSSRMFFRFSKPFRRKKFAKLTSGGQNATFPYKTVVYFSLFSKMSDWQSQMRFFCKITNFSPPERKFKNRNCTNCRHDDSIYTRTKEIGSVLLQIGYFKHGASDHSFVWESGVLTTRDQLCEFFSTKRFRKSKKHPA